jgi:hypothetical protein
MILNILSFMSRKVKILLGIFIPIIVIGAGFGITFLTLKWPAVLTKAPPVIGFPLVDSNVIDGIWGFGDHNGEFHGGIDFIINTSVDIIAVCKLRVIMVSTFQNDANGRWQTNVNLQYNWKYEFEYLFESLAQNETYANQQRDAILVKFGQILEPGEIIGKLFFHESQALLHFGVKESKTDICAYQFFNPSAKTTFLDLWNICGYGDSSWYT